MDTPLPDKTFERATVFVSGYLVGFRQSEVRWIRFHVKALTGGGHREAATLVERGKRKEETIPADRVVAIEGWDHPELQVLVPDGRGGSRSRFLSFSEEWDTFLDDYLKSLGNKLSVIIDGRRRSGLPDDPRRRAARISAAAAPLVGQSMPNTEKQPSVDPPSAGGDDFLAGLEGEVRVRMIRHRRREQELRDAKILTELKRVGRLQCEVSGCGFDFAQVYGEIGSGFAHVHHLRPLAEYEGAEETHLSDLAIVCANCHAMIHRGGECRPLEGLLGARDAEPGG